MAGWPCRIRMMRKTRFAAVNRPPPARNRAYAALQSRRAGDVKCGQAAFVWRARGRQDCEMGPRDRCATGGQPSTSRALRARDVDGWLGREGSNLRMPESKSGALPLGDAPTGSRRGGHRIARPLPRRKRGNPVSCQGFRGRLRGLGGIVIRAPPEAGPNPLIVDRRVAQPGRALRSGRRGRRFESSLSDHF